MKDRIETEVVKTGELERNVKLGRGGIREIEFVVQALQLLHGGRQPFLQGAQTLPGLEKLAQYDLIPGEVSRSLRDAYCFLRDVEHRLQMENDRQTHTIPADKPAQERLARLMGFADQRAFEAARHSHTECVRRVFESVLKAEVAPAREQAPAPGRFEGAEEEWRELLKKKGFKDLERALRVLREFVEGPGYVHVSPRTTALAHGLLQRVFAFCPGEQKPEDQNSKSERDPESDLPRSRQNAARGLMDPSTGARSSDDGFRPSGFGLPGKGLASRQPVLSDPDRVVTRLDNFISAYGARATLFELWHSNPAIFDLLLLLFDRSEFLAELAIRTPDLVDELVTSGRLRQRKSAEATLRDLRHGLKDEDQALWLRKYHQTEVMRIGLRDILGLAGYEQYLTELSSLADACLQYALEAVMRQHKIKSPPFVIVGLGKLGGAEIDYGSDLDILFVADPKAKNLLKSKSLALAVLELVSSRTEQGLVFHTDARLRPDGEKGLLVNSLTAYEEYYRRRAMLWEIQTLTRSRPIAGDMKVGARFQEMAGRLTDFSLAESAAGRLRAGLESADSPDADADRERAHGTRAGRPGHQNRRRRVDGRGVRRPDTLFGPGLAGAEHLASLGAGRQARGAAGRGKADRELLAAPACRGHSAPVELRRRKRAAGRSRAVLPGIGALRVRFTGAIWRGFTRLPASHPRGLCQGVFDRTSSG